MVEQGIEVRKGAVVEEFFQSTLNQCESFIKDLHFSALREWKEKSGKKVVGYFPVYTPVELIDAAGAIPVGLYGGGNVIEISHADAVFGSFICSIVKSTMELCLNGALEFLDALFFSGICDSARNLSFVVERNFPEKRVLFLHLPQNLDSPAALPFLKSEYERAKAVLEELTGNRLTEDALRQSILKFNENRRLVRELYAIRRNRPGKLATYELYLLNRAGNFLPVEEHNALLQRVLQTLEERSTVERDRIRVLVEGSFCEQPPVEMLKLLDEVACHILDDDFVLGRHFIAQDVTTDGNVFEALAHAYLAKSRYSSVKHPGKKPRVEQFLEKVHSLGVDAVLFLYAKFCEPGLFDYVLFKDCLEKEGIPHLFIEFEEKMWTFDRVRLELETFVESLIFADGGK